MMCSFLAIGSLGNMEILVIMLLASVVLGVPLIAFLVLLVAARLKKAEPTDPASPPPPVQASPPPQLPSGTTPEQSAEHEGQGPG